MGLPCLPDVSTETRMPGSNIYKVTCDDNCDKPSPPKKSHDFTYTLYARDKYCEETEEPRTIFFSERTLTACSNTVVHNQAVCSPTFYFSPRLHVCACVKLGYICDLAIPPTHVEGKKTDFSVYRLHQKLRKA